MQHIFDVIESQPEEIILSLTLTSYIYQRDLYGMTAVQAASIFNNAEKLEGDYQSWLQTKQ